MRKQLPLAVVFVVVLGGAIAIASPRNDDREAQTHARTLRFGVAFSPFNFVDIGERGISPGDEITAHDRLFNRRDIPSRVQVGHDGVVCTVTNPHPVETICEVIFRVPGGTITGEFFSRPGPAPKHGAVTGGTGLYRKSRGHFTLVESGQDKNIKRNKLTIFVTDPVRRPT
jgi:hypothetical protein